MEVDLLLIHFVEFLLDSVQLGLVWLFRLVSFEEEVDCQQCVEWVVLLFVVLMRVFGRIFCYLVLIRTLLIACGLAFNDF